MLLLLSSRPIKIKLLLFLELVSDIVEQAAVFNLSFNDSVNNNQKSGFVSISLIFSDNYLLYTYIITYIFVCEPSVCDVSCACSDDVRTR